MPGRQCAPCCTLPHCSTGQRFDMIHWRPHTVHHLVNGQQCHEWGHQAELMLLSSASPLLPPPAGHTPSTPGKGRGGPGAPVAWCTSNDAAECPIPWQLWGTRHQPGRTCTASSRSTCTQGVPCSSAGLHSSPRKSASSNLGVANKTQRSTGRAQTTGLGGDAWEFGAQLAPDSLLIFV